MTVTNDQGVAIDPKDLVTLEKRHLEALVEIAEAFYETGVEEEQERFFAAIEHAKERLGGEGT